MTTSKTIVFPSIIKTIDDLDFESISKERQVVLQPLIEYIQNKGVLRQEVRLNFICTHNSRRSHLAQIWAQTAVAHFNIKKVFCYSGGTEATAIFPMVVKTLQQSGFIIKTILLGPDPIHPIKYAENEHPIIGFSKTYDHDFNPQSEFAAIMTCSQADGSCPFIAGAEKRIPITYEDPKAFDNTVQQVQKISATQFANCN